MESEQKTTRRPRKPILQELEKLMGKIVRIFYVIHSINGEAANFMQYRLVKKEGKNESEPIGTAQVCVDEGILIHLDDNILKLKQEIVGALMQKESDRVIIIDLESCHITSVVYSIPV